MNRLLAAALTGSACLTLAVSGAISASAVPTAPAHGIPNQLASANALDKVNHTVTLPIFKGEAPGFGDVWFILTESSDFHDAVRRGINWSPKLVNALGTAAVQPASLEDTDHRPVQGRDIHRRFDKNSEVLFQGGVDFSGQRAVIPGPHLFPLDPASHAGPVADQHYSPMFTFGDGVVYNGAEIANRTGRHGKVLLLDTHARAATLRLTAGFYLGRDVLYLSTESSVTQIAALENATYTPNLAAAPQAGNDDPSISAREPIIPIVNGPRGKNNPDRQGLRSAVAGEGDPLNIIREEPECSDPKVPASCSALQYRPMWDVHPVAWTPAAIDAGLRTRVTSHQTVESLFQQGELVNAAPDGPVNHDPEINGLRAAGVVVNCPPMFVAPPA